MTLNQKITARGALATRGYTTPPDIRCSELVFLAGLVFYRGIATCFGLEKAGKINLRRNRDGKPVKNTVCRVTI
jgi:hypothetical protein